MNEAWDKVMVPRALAIVSTMLSQREVCSLLLVSRWCYQALLSVPSLWKVLDFHGMHKAGERLIAALSLPRYCQVQHINLEFSQDIEDKHLILVKDKYMKSLERLLSLNLNGCQKVSDKGIEAIAYACPNLKIFNIYWNVRVSDTSIMHLVKHCEYIIDLNLSGCKNITDQSLFSIADKYKELEALNLTRCVKLTDTGLQQILLKCTCLRSLNLYALSTFSDYAYEKISFLKHLRYLDLCGSQNLSDSALTSIATCKDLISINLSWCVRITDVGVLAIVDGCTSLEFLSLFGIVGVTDKCLEALSRSCSTTLATLDVNGCIGIKKRSRYDLLRLFPNLRCFKVHS